MDIFSILSIVFGLTYISGTIYLANYVQTSGTRADLLRLLLYGVPVITILYTLLIVQISLMPLSDDAGLPVDPTAALVAFGIVAVLSGVSIGMIRSAGVRRRLRGLLPTSATYNPESPVHVTAFVLMMGLLSLTIGQFVLGGGLSGLAESYEATGGVSFDDVLFEQALWIFAATLGIGLFLRRTGPQALARLGLRFPQNQDVNWGIGIGLLLFVVLIAFSTIWTIIVSPEELQQQTAASAELASSFNSLPLALAISIVVAIGEEVFFRGAIQPVFGIWFTSLFFALLHTQYTLTPATIIILVAALGLGWLRQRYSTSASIIGHFVYNFIQLALAALVGSSI